MAVSFVFLHFENKYSPKPLFYLSKVKISRMKPAPLLFITAILLMMLQKEEGRFLLVNVDDGEDVGLNTAQGNFPKRFNCPDYIRVDDNSISTLKIYHITILNYRSVFEA